MLRPALAASIVLFAGCSGTGSAGQSLSPGTYVISNGVTQTDACQAIGDVSSTDGTTFQVVSVSASDIQFQFNSNPAFSAARSGSTFSVTSTADYDWTNTGTSGLAHAYDCQEHDVFSFSGTISGHDRLSIIEDAQFTDTSGSAADCIAAVNSKYSATITVWPCESHATFDGSKQ